MRVVISLDGNTIVAGVDFKKATPAGLEMLAERPRDGPKQFVGIRPEPGAPPAPQQKERVGLGLLAPRDISNGDVHAEHLAGFGVNRIVTANTNAAILRTSPITDLNLLIDPRLTGVDHAAVMNFNAIGKFRHGFANRFADEKFRRPSIHFRQCVVYRYVVQLPVDETKANRSRSVDGFEMGQAFVSNALILTHYFLGMTMAQT